MLHEEFAPASRPRTESLFPLALCVSPPFVPPYITGHSQLVSFSLSLSRPPFPRLRLSPAFFRPRSLALVYPAAPFSPPPCPGGLSHHLPSLSAISIPSPLALLFPAPALTRENFFPLFMQLSIVVVVFRLTPYRSFSITRSVLNARRVSRLSSSSSNPSLSTPRDRASIHPPDFSLFRSLFLLLPSFSLFVSLFLFLRSSRLSIFHLPTATISTTYLTSRASFRRLYLKH